MVTIERKNAAGDTVAWLRGESEPLAGVLEALPGFVAQANPGDAFVVALAETFVGLPDVALAARLAKELPAEAKPEAAAKASGPGLSATLPDVGE